MRTVATFAALLAVASPLAAQQHQHPQGTPAQPAAHGEHAAPAGWQYRLDRATADRSAVHFMQMGDGMHFTLGPAGIFYNPQNTRTGAYRLTATFAQTRAPQHPEAYGLVLAGSNLEAANQSYIYFIVRGTGEYAIKHRAGDEVHTIVDWTANPAVHRQDAEGKASNVLTVDVSPDALSYMVNGTEVHRQARADAGHPINADGLFGIRVNHNLDVHVSGLQATGH
jgi:hypothetical protein